MRRILLFLFFSATINLVTARPYSAEASNEVAVVTYADVATPDADAFPIFGKKKTSNKKQRKFATKRSRRHGKGIMRARKSRGKGKTKGGRGGSKKKEGCNT